MICVAALLLLVRRRFANRYFNTSVTHILTTVTEALSANPSRRFIWSEIKVTCARSPT